jgi:hypothetical protein
MKRSILVSLLVIGTVGAFTFGTGTFAPFTAEDSDSGTITAGGVSISVEGTGASLDFDSGAAGCDDAVLPGDTCGPDTVTVTNTGTVDLTITSIASSEAGDLEVCGDGDNLTTTTTALTDVAGDGAAALAAGDSETFDVDVTLEGDATNDCQGDSGTVTVTVTASS